MRSILENVAAYDLHIKQGLRFGTITQTLSGPFQIPPDAPPVTFFDAGGSARVVTLPSITNGVGMDGQVRMIINVGASGALTVNAHADDGGGNVSVVPAGGGINYLVASMVKLAWYDFSEGTSNPALLASATKSTIILPMQLVDIAAGTFKVAVPYAFTVTSALFRTIKPASTAAKLATLTVGINGVAVTGGVMSLTTANQNTIGGTVAATAITALNVGTAGQTLEVAASAVTAFVEGDGQVEFTVSNNDLLGILQ